MSQLAEGQTFAGRYILVRRLGEGGFAEVYLAREATGEREVAIKVLKPDAADGSFLPQTRARFRREVEGLGRLRDPHSVRMFDAGEVDGRLYLVFEVVPGRSLDQVLAEGPLPEGVVRHVLIQMLHALREAHAHRLLHRDIKPHNIHVFEYMGDPWTAKLLDFGVAKDLLPTDAKVTQTGALVGTPRYMSPEQLQTQQLTPASDIYSLGMTAYEMLVGSQNMHGIGLSDQFERLMKSGAISVPGTASGLHAIVQKMIARETRDRFSSAEEVLAALGVAPSAPVQQPQQTVPQQSGPVPIPTHQPAAKSPPLIPIAVGLVLAVVGASFALWKMVEEPEPESAPPVSKRTSIAALTQPAAPSKPSEPEPQPKPVPAEEPTLSQEGCGKTPHRPGKRIALEDKQGREVNVFVPSDYDNTKPYPLVILLHDRWETAKSLWWDSGFEPTAEKEKLIVIAPRDQTGMQNWTDDADFKFPQEAVEFVAEGYCVDPTRVYMVGNGVGAGLAEMVSCETQFFAGLATMSHRTRPGLECRYPRPTIHFTALEDKSLPPEGGQGCGSTVPSLVEHESYWRSVNVCTGEREEISSWRENKCFSWSCLDPFVSCELAAGRGWPKRDDKRDHDFMNCDGDSLSDYDMAGEIWKFFEKSEAKTSSR